MQGWREKQCSTPKHVYMSDVPGSLSLQQQSLFWVSFLSSFTYKVEGPKRIGYGRA
jgi:hypothetical protein